MSKLLDTIEGAEIRQEANLEVNWTADADIDADGANAQFGEQAAYMVGNRGSEHLANGGMGMRNGRVVGVTTWYKNIVILAADGQPKEFPGGIIASKTAYRFPTKSAGDPAAYVDSETVPYICVPPSVRQRAKGVVLGCRGIVTYKGRAVECVVADIGPRRKVGEISIAAARAIGIPHSPRTGGVDGRVVGYKIFPGTPAELAGVHYPLLPAPRG